MKKIFILFFFLSVPMLSLAQPADYNNIDNWKSICYCSYNLIHPQTIVKADNNWQLLLALRNGLSLVQLDSLNISYTQSQLLLLRSQRLVRRSQNIYTTAIPIFDKEQTINMRTHSQVIANNLYSEIEQECRDLVAHLSLQNKSSNAFSILFSYVLDGLMWERFEKEGIVTERDRTGIWSGYYWFLTPKRASQWGTNSLSIGEFEFSVNWSVVEDITDGLFDNDFEALFKSITKDGFISDQKVFDEFSVFGFFDQNSALTIPIINEKERNELCTLSDRIIDKLLPAFMTKENIETFKILHQFGDMSEAVVIIYHEVMWDLMDLLLKNNVIQSPTIFLSPENAKSTDAADLCFIVIRNS